MAAVTSNPVTELLFRTHPWVCRTFKGRVLGAMGGVPISLLTTTDRKSGERRETCLMYVDKGDAWVVTASYAGQPEHPGWYRSLRKNPRASLRLRDRVIPVCARDAHGEERASLWREIVAQDEGFAVYEERTRGVRDIPVVVFEPDRDAAAMGAEA